MLSDFYANPYPSPHMPTEDPRVVQQDRDDATLEALSDTYGEHISDALEDIYPGYPCELDEHIKAIADKLAEISLRDGALVEDMLGSQS